MEIIFVLAILWLGFSHRNLAKRVKDLEARIGAGVPQPAGIPEPADEAPLAPAEPVPAADAGPWQPAKAPPSW